MSKNKSSSKQKKLSGSSFSSSSSSLSSSSSSSSSGSSIAELFEPPSSPPSSSSSIFRSVFGPPSMGRGRSSTTHVGNVRHAAPGNGGQSNMDQNSKGSYYQETIEQPCYYSSSIFYGGQEVYSPSTGPADSHLTFKKEEQEDDPNCASRGNWWQGSLYY